MRKQEEKFTSGAVRIKAESLGRLIQSYRLNGNLTQLAAAERGRMSQFTWLKIEKGDVSVSMGSWLSAMEVLGLLDKATLPEPALMIAEPRQRARNSPAVDDLYDF